MDDILLRSDDVGVATLTLNSPANLNALSDAMLAALADAFRALSQDDSIRAIVLRGSGKAFCAGHDLKEMQAKRAAPDGGAAALADLFNRCAEVMTAIPRLPQPVIAEVHGIATAAGCQLVASCDMAVAAEGTRFGVNGVNIGLFCSTPMVALTRNIARKQAFEMLTTGEFIDAPRARELGLVNRVTDGSALDGAKELAASIAANGPLAVRVSKQIMKESRGWSMDERYDKQAQLIGPVFMSEDAREGAAAFAEKRKPNWKGK